MVGIAEELRRLYPLRDDFDFENDTWGLMLLNMGAPRNDSEIKPYLKSIFTDKAIIKMPLSFVLQRPLAHLIAHLRASKVQKRYELVGGSPLPKISDQLAAVLKKHLRSTFRNVQVYSAMRYSPPHIGDQIDRALQRGCRFILAISLYPHYCHATTGSALLEIRRHFRRARGAPALAVIDEFHDHPDYIDLLRRRIEAAMTEIGGNDKKALVFSAHSVPTRLPESGDPYVSQIEKSSRLAAGANHYFVAYQSRTGPVEWVGPDLLELLAELKQQDYRQVVIVPISFVIDNLETVYDLDIVARRAAGKIGLGMTRVDCLNADSDFTEFLAGLVSKRFERAGNRD